MPSFNPAASRSAQTPIASAPAAPQALLIPGFLSLAEAENRMASLRQELAFRPDELMIAGRRVITKREADYRGDPDASYAYSGALKRPAPWTPVLSELRDQAAIAAGASFNACLCNWYASGAAALGWHADDEPELGADPVIASLSFGQPRLFRFRLKRPWRDAEGGGQTWDFLLSPGDLLIMSGPTQRFFEHQLPADARAAEARLNLTFRRVFQTRR